MTTSILKSVLYCNPARFGNSNKSTPTRDIYTMLRENDKSCTISLTTTIITSQSMYTGYGSASPPLTNNPFLAQTGQSVTSRFPDISSPNHNSSSPFASWPSGSSTTGGIFPQQQQSNQYPQSPLQHPYGSQLGYSPGYFSPPTQTFPSSPPFQMQNYDNPFGQQQKFATAAPHVSGSSYSYLSSAQQQPNTPYGPAQQQLQTNQGYLAQFDPYGAIGQGWEGGAASNNNNNSITPSVSTGSTLSTASTSSSFSGSSFGVGPKGDSHPRDYIRTHKSQMEAWDSYTWKQFLNSIEALKLAWEERKSEFLVRAKGVIAQGQSGMAYGGYVAQQIQQEASRLQQVRWPFRMIRRLLTEFFDRCLKRQNQTSVRNIKCHGSYLRSIIFCLDSVAASLFQMQEVFHGYRQSGDAASKARVREATNAALKGLPNWPSPI